MINPSTSTSFPQRQDHAPLKTTTNKDLVPNQTNSNIDDDLTYIIPRQTRWTLRDEIVPRHLTGGPDRLAFISSRQCPFEQQRQKLPSGFVREYVYHAGTGRPEEEEVEVEAGWYHLTTQEAWNTLYEAAETKTVAYVKLANKWTNSVVGIPLALYYHAKVKQTMRYQEIALERLEMDTPKQCSSKLNQHGPSKAFQQFFTPEGCWVVSHQMRQDLGC